ncbi:hypothetical protein ACFSX9_00155 [Flavobacterium ardleyense]|uniref:Uncharacterized protein n=1 Tax=Flavobacterium ardleyense TaxID=2038737 RepID=A0ABW5Z2Z4_9FLAO
MKKFNQNVLLDQKIAELTSKRDIELLELKNQYHVVIESVKPINIVKQSISSFYNSPTKKLNVLELATSFVGGYISKKLVVGHSKSMITRTLGNVLQYTISTVINKFNKKKHENSI